MRLMESVALDAALSLGHGLNGMRSQYCKIGSLLAAIGFTLALPSGAAAQDTIQRKDLPEWMRRPEAKTWSSPPYIKGARRLSDESRWRLFIRVLQDNRLIGMPRRQVEDVIGVGEGDRVARYSITYKFSPGARGHHVCGTILEVAYGSDGRVQSFTVEGLYTP
jgi:hypothetical protein